MILIDTSVWSLALRREKKHLSQSDRDLTEEWARLVREGLARLIGPVRQELLSGVRHEADFVALLRHLSSFDDISILSSDYVEAARFFNTCRRHGIAGTPVDLLICAVAARNNLAIFTTDRDFDGYARHLPIRLHAAR
jgi:predicted nucleic acid-binding protein